MKKILSKLILTISLGLFSGFANAQTDSSIVRVCYNTTVEVVKKDSVNKEGKPKIQNNCFELKTMSVVFTNSKGKVFVYDIIHIEEQYTSSGLTYFLHVTIDGKYLQMLVHADLQYISVHSPVSNKTQWYFTAL